MLALNGREQAKLEAFNESNKRENSTSWDDTTILILNDIARLFASYIDKFLKDSQFITSWATLLHHLEGFLSRQRPNLSVAVFTSIREILASIGASTPFEHSYLEPVWTLWLKHSPVQLSSTPVEKTYNNDVLLAYVQSFGEIYRLTRYPTTEERIAQVLQSLHECVTAPNEPAHMANVESLTQLQKQVFESIKALCLDAPGAPSSVIKWLAKFIIMPFEYGSSGSQVRPFTFIAMAKACMDQTQSVVIKFAKAKELYSSSAFCHALEAFVTCIRSYHTIQMRAEGTSMRMASATTALTILASAIPAIGELRLEQATIHLIWVRIVDIADALLRVNQGNFGSPIESAPDQDFDINSFLALRNLIIPGLGSAKVPDAMRRKYSQILFDNSLIHDPEPSDLPEDKGELLKGLYDIRMGRAYDPPASKRSKMSYVCLDELFALVMRHDGSAEWVRLAQAASPYLILRVAITLRDYIAVSSPPVQMRDGAFKIVL